MEALTMACYSIALFVKFSIGRLMKRRIDIVF